MSTREGGKKLIRVAV